MSFFSRMSVEMSNALSDAYGNLVYGDDAGKSAKLVFVAKPRATLSPTSPTTTSTPNLVPVSSRFELGVTFLEVNGRAYVHSVSPDGPAERAGVQPRDCVQFAAVLGGDLIDLREDDNKAALFALECEKRGMRSTFDDLTTMFADCLITSPSEGQTPPPPPSSPDAELTSLDNLPLRPTASETLRSGLTTAVQGCSPSPPPTRPLPPSIPTPNHRFPVVLVFRRTRKRQSFPLAAPIGLPSFRLDDECDRAAALIRRLAPTSEMAPDPDAWDEIVHDGTEWLLPSGSIMPPKQGSVTLPRLKKVGLGSEAGWELKRQKSGDYSLAEETIPVDKFESESCAKMSQIRQRMQTETKQKKHGDDLEASTIRGMIQKAVGLAFVRMSKLVLGVSVHCGSGIIIARLPDGTWSAPSAIGICGAGLGLQFGLEVADYLFVLQTEECLGHFRRGGSFTLGGNLGAALAGFGREACGAASVGGSLCSPKGKEVPEDGSKEKLMELAPILAYGRSQGLYFGVSLEGNRIFTREDINARTYKFTMGRGVTSGDILGGKVATPPEAEDLYASLHSVEFTHEISGIPRPPEILRKDSPNEWRYNQSTLSSPSSSTLTPPFSFLSTISDGDAEECSAFETTFKKFLYGGVSVQRLVTGGDTNARRERRTLWLMLPEVGALRLGFISKMNEDGVPKKPVRRGRRFKLNRRSKSSKSAYSDDGTGYSTDSFSESLGSMTDDYTMTSDDGTLDTNTETVATKQTEDENPSKAKRNVHLSSKHSVALTDVTLLTQDPNVSIRHQDATEHLRVISITDVSSTTLLFLANNFREAELLVCGLKLLLERETARLGVRGGVPLTQLGGVAGSGAMSPAQARGRDGQVKVIRGRRYEGENEGESSSDHSDSETMESEEKGVIPEGRRSWSQVPARGYLRDQASRSQSSEDLRVKQGQQQKEEVGEGPKYVYGQLIIRDIAVGVRLPLPLPLCRVLLLDSSSPVITKWELDRGDTNYSKTRWSFPPSTPREQEHHTSEHKLIASGSMMGAHRTTTYNRHRNGDLIQLTETQIVDADDVEKVAFSLTERMPRRGFSVKVRILLRAADRHECEATVLGEVRPMGKNMSNQMAVHRALLLVIEEIKMRYGTEGKGLLAGFISVVNNLPNPNAPPQVTIPAPREPLMQQNQNQRQQYGGQRGGYQQQPPVQLQQQQQQQLRQYVGNQMHGHSHNQNQEQSQAHVRVVNQPQHQYQHQRTQPIQTPRQQSPRQSLQQQQSQQQQSQQQHQQQQRQLPILQPPPQQLPQQRQRHLHQKYPQQQITANTTTSSHAHQPEPPPITINAQKPIIQPPPIIPPPQNPPPTTQTVYQKRTNLTVNTTRQITPQRISTPSSPPQRTPPSTPPSQPSLTSFPPLPPNTTRPATPGVDRLPTTAAPSSAIPPPAIMDEPKPLTIDVKPLPKIRLDLMPAPREEDEDDEESDEGKSPVQRTRRRRRTRGEALRSRR